MEIKYNKFGDGISWEDFAVEVLNSGKSTFYKYDINDYKDPNLEIINRIKRYKYDGKLLDCGCNIGRWIELFKGAGYDYAGVDQSQHVINIAKIFHPNDKFINKFLWDIDFDNEFDIAISNTVLQHNTLEEKHRIIPKIYKALKKGGILFINESTVIEETNTQLSYYGWIKIIESYGFKLIESWHKNELNIDDYYIFIKE